MTQVSAYKPAVPGVTGVLGGISAAAAYANISKKDVSKQMDAVAKAPQVSRETDYFKSAITKMKDVKDLLADKRALQYLTTAYGLGSASSQMGIIKQVLSQDPEDKNSLVNKLAEGKWKTMAKDLATFSTGLATIKGTKTTQTIDVDALDGQYFQIQKKTTTTYGTGSDAQSLSSTQNLYANSLSGLTLAPSGILQTSDGYQLLGLKLDNNGKIQPPVGQNSTNAQDEITNFSGNAVLVNQSFTNLGNGNWQWTVKDKDEKILSQTSLALTLNPDGTLATINGNPATSTSQSITLNWKDGTTTQSFDLAKAFTAGSNQYQTNADLRTVQLSWFDEKSTPTKKITPNVVLNGSQAIPSNNLFSNVNSVATGSKDADGKEINAAVTQTFSKNPDDTWKWEIKNSDNTLLYSQDNINLTFDGNGTLSAIGSSTNLNPSVELDWGNGTKTNQTFDLKSLFNQPNFSQTAKVTDNIGTERGLRLDYFRTDKTSNSWQVKVWDTTNNRVAQVIDFDFDAKGNVKSAGKFNSATGQIENSDKLAFGREQSFTVDWGRGYGGSTITLDLSKVNNLGTTNSDTGSPATDSVKLGKRSSINIDENGTVSATYNKADGSGTITLDVYRLAVNKFANSSNLRDFGSTKYESATFDAAKDSLRPLGTEKDLLGNLIEGRAGKLETKPKITNSKNTLDSITNGYLNYTYQEALGEENQALRYAVYFKQNASKIKSTYGLLGDRAARDLVSSVFSIPKEVARQSLSTQEQIFSKKVNVKDLQNPDYVDKLIKRFLAISDANGGSGKTASSPVASLLGGDTVDGGTLLNIATSTLSVRA